MKQYLQRILNLDQFKDTPHLTGLRAYAALMVFFIHSEGAGLRGLTFASPFLTKLVNNTVSFGIYGIVIFFVLSAYTIAMSLDRSEKVSYWPYLMRRLLRVLPMYYIMVIIAYLYGGAPNYFQPFEAPSSWHSLWTHLTFLNFFELEHRNNLLAVEWSIPVEIAYYLIMPFLFTAVKKYRDFSAQLFMLGLSIVFLAPALTDINSSQARYMEYQWSLSKYAFCFFLGLVLYPFQKKYQAQFSKIGDIILIELFIVLIFFIASERPFHEEFMALWTAGLILVLNSRPRLGRLLFENRFVLLIGTVSYSFYLIHFPILTLTRKYFSHPTAIFGFAFTTTLILSILAYNLIEKPFVEFGRRRFR